MSALSNRQPAKEVQKGSLSDQIDRVLNDNDRLRRLNSMFVHPPVNGITFRTHSEDEKKSYSRLPTIIELSADTLKKLEEKNRELQEIFDKSNVVRSEDVKRLEAERKLRQEQASSVNYPSPIKVLAVAALAIAYLFRATISRYFSA